MDPGPSLPQVHESLFLFQLQVSLPTIAATLIGVIPDMWAAKIRCLDRNFSPQQANKKMTTFRAKKKILPPQKKTPFPGILYNHGRLFYHHTFFKACCLWDYFRMTVWSVIILKQTSSYVLFHSSSVKHLAGWNFSISEWSLVHLLCSSSTGVDFILWLSHHGMPRLNVASWIMFPAPLSMGQTKNGAPCTELYNIT